MIRFFWAIPSGEEPAQWQCQLAQMEEEAGVKLFDRGTRKISLTNEGILLRRRAEEIIELMDITMKEKRKTTL